VRAGRHFGPLGLHVVHAGPAELLADLSRALRTLGVRWYVFGAQAVLIWGGPA
jgi:hypothetical protein